jgi:hypothetical protein
MDMIQWLESCRMLLMLARVFAFFWCEFVSCASKLCSMMLLSPQSLAVLCDAPHVRSTSKVAIELFSKVLLVAV